MDYNLIIDIIYIILLVYLVKKVHEIGTILSSDDNEIEESSFALGHIPDNKIELNQFNKISKGKYKDQALSMNSPFDGIMQDALAYADFEKQYANSKPESYEMHDGVRIKIIGCGGAGCNTINRLHNLGIANTETIAIDTDSSSLNSVQADMKIIIGKSITSGWGAGGNPDLGRKAAEMARKTLVEVLDGVDMVFVIAGMGGGTGTGSTPVVASIAKELGAIVIVIVSTPFKVEHSRKIKAEEGLKCLRNASDTIVILDNNKLLEFVPNLPIASAFSLMDQLIADIVKGISDTITQQSFINIDYADFRAIMSHGGDAAIFVAESSSQNRAEDIARMAQYNPLIDVDCRGATGALVLVTGGPDMTLRDAEEVASVLTYDLDSNATVIWGARMEEDFEGKLKVVAIMTGITRNIGGTE